MWRGPGAFGGPNMTDHATSAQRASILALAAILLGAAPAAAADLAARPGTPGFDWAGFYAGLSAGGERLGHQWKTSMLSSPAFGVDGSSTSAFDHGALRLGGFLGYNFKFKDNLILGVEADVAGLAGGGKTIAGIPGDIFNQRLAIIGGGAVGPLADRTRVETKWNGSLRGRFGVLVTPTTLLYGTAGLTLADTRYGIDCAGPGALNNAASFCTRALSGSTDSVRLGATVGAGVEAVLAGNWLVRAQYRYSDYGTRSISFFSGTDRVNAKVRSESNLAEIGIAYKF